MPESVNYYEVDNPRTFADKKRGKKSPHPVINIPSSMALPYHYETMENEVEDATREQDTSKMSPKTLLSYLTVQQKLKAEREEVDRSTMYEEEFMKSYSETRGRNAANGKGSHPVKDDEVEQAAWKSITPHRSTCTDKSGRFELKKTASSNTEDAPVMKRLNFESSTFASAAKRRDKNQMSATLVKQKKSAKKWSSLRKKKPPPDCRKGIKVHINPFRLKGGILASSMAKLWAATIIPFQVCLSTRQSRRGKRRRSGR